MKPALGSQLSSGMREYLEALSAEGALSPEVLLRSVSAFFMHPHGCLQCTMQGYWLLALPVDSHWLQADQTVLKERKARRNAPPPSAYQPSAVPCAQLHPASWLHDAQHRLKH